MHLHGAHSPSDADGWPDNMSATGSDQLSAYPNSYDNLDLGLGKVGDPGNVVEVAIRFDIAGPYVYHCHILEHEDTEMMRPFVVTDSSVSR